MSKQYTKIAGRYASALQKAVKESGVDAKLVADELVQVAGLWETNLELSTSMSNPFFSKNDRQKALKGVLESLSLSAVVQRFITIVFNRDRIKALGEISEVYARLVEEAAGVVRVNIQVARELGADEKSEIESSLATQLQGQAQYEWLVNPEILGGLIVEYQGHILDGSVSGRLDRLERQLLG